MGHQVQIHNQDANFRGNDKNQCHNSWTSLPVLKIYKGQENENEEICDEDLLGIVTL